MNIDKLSPGAKIPKEVNVVIEIPSHSGPVKYEIDKESGAMMVDRFMTTAMFYPCNYGYIPHSLSEDGDPADVLVITPVPLISGAVLAVRPIGILDMEDEAGGDAKILAVPTKKLLPMFSHIHEPEDISPHQLAIIQHFFEHYKDLEEGKWVKVKGWGNAQKAEEEVMRSIQRYQREVNDSL
jgi:inorganic pyrophosphatase